MNKNFVIILGQHRLIRSLLEAKADNGKTFFFTSLVDMLKETNKNEGIDFWFEVIDKEIERDKIILEKLDNGNKVFVEQWHVGNWSRIRSLGVDLSPEVQNNLRQKISSLITQIRTFYVSTDLEKYYFDADLLAKRNELNVLSKVLRELGIATENLDGDATKDDLKKRLNFLLEQESKII